MLVMSVFGVCFVSCGGDDANNETPSTSNEARVYFVYTLDTSTGDMMTRGAKTNAEVFDEFYQKIITGDLVAPSFELTLTEVNSGVVYTFKGKWNSHDLLTLRTGTYRVVGKSTADGDNIQEKCSFTFDEQIDISITSNVITLHAKYDCSLLIFNSEKIQTLQNFNGSALALFFTFSTYRYAFVNNTLYDVAKKNEAYILGKYTDDAEFKIFTGNLNFEKGKYYVYNSISNGFDVPPMDEGTTTNESNERKSLNDYIANSTITIGTGDYDGDYFINPIINNIKKVYVDITKSSGSSIYCYLGISNKEGVEEVCFSSKSFNSTSSDNLYYKNKPYNIKQSVENHTFSWLYYNPDNSNEVIINVEELYGQVGYIKKWQHDFGTSCVVNIVTNGY